MPPCKVPRLGLTTRAPAAAQRLPPLLLAARLSQCARARGGPGRVRWAAPPPPPAPPCRIVPAGARATANKKPFRGLWSRPSHVSARATFLPARGAARAGAPVVGPSVRINRGGRGRTSRAGGSAVCWIACPSGGGARLWSCARHHGHHRRRLTGVTRTHGRGTSRAELLGYLPPARLHRRPALVAAHGLTWTREVRLAAHPPRPRSGRWPAGGGWRKILTGVPAGLGHSRRRRRRRARSTSRPPRTTAPAVGTHRVPPARALLLGDDSLGWDHYGVGGGGEAPLSGGARTRTRPPLPPPPF